MTAITSNMLRRFLELAADRLAGNWVVIGGAVLQLVKPEGARTTIDIDLAGPLTSTQSDTITLMDIAVEIGLPVEAINQAGAFFLRKIPDWQDQLVNVHKGKTAVFLRPNITLFVLLKIGRLNEVDLGDCVDLLALARKLGEHIDTDRLLKSIAIEIPMAQTEMRLSHLRILQKNLTA